MQKYKSDTAVSQLKIQKKQKKIIFCLLDAFSQLLDQKINDFSQLPLLVNINDQRVMANYRNVNEFN